MPVLLMGSAPLRVPGSDGQPDSHEEDQPQQRLGAGVSDALGDLLAQEVGKPDVHPDPADAGDDRPEHEQGEPHPEDPGHERRHRHGRHEGMTAEGTVAFGQQFPAPFLDSSRVVEHLAPPAPADLISGDRAQHPGGRRGRDQDAHVELALSGQRARRDQRRVTGPGYAGSQDHDEREQDDVLGQGHGAARVIMGSARRPGVPVSGLRAPAGSPGRGGLPPVPRRRSRRPGPARMHRLPRSMARPLRGLWWRHLPAPCASMAGQGNGSPEAGRGRLPSAAGCSMPEEREHEALPGRAG
jgi:hypothetical protein